MTAHDDVEVLVLLHLSALCKKLAKIPDVREDLRVKAHEFVEEGNALLPYRGRATPFQHSQGERLFVRIARFLPELLGYTR